MGLSDIFLLGLRQIFIRSAVTTEILTGISLAQIYAIAMRRS